MSSWFILEFEAGWAGDEPETPPVPPVPPALGGDAVIEEHEFRFPGRLALKRKKRLRIRKPKPVEKKHRVVLGKGGYTLVRSRTFAFPAQRLPATRIVMAKRDDDELLTLL